MSPVLTYIPTFVNLSQPSLYVSLASITVGPLVWNVVGQNEYKNRTLTKVIGARVACTVLGVSIFLAGLLRDVLYRIALHDQPKYPLPFEIQTVLSWIIFGGGNILVATSYWKLGFYGTFVGDYFGILLEKRVTSFPFSLFNNPMYMGAKLSFIGAALWYERPAGLLVCIYVHLVYTIALRFESPFTDMIYANRQLSTKRE
ncbi:phospholipid methyltransferase-domain-containing protein [Mycena crocata]|nr:phospholipid methyltransferase-domain-containing protein [Mycena crocata]